MHDAHLLGVSLVVVVCLLVQNSELPWWLWTKTKMEGDVASAVDQEMSPEDRALTLARGPQRGLAGILFSKMLRDQELRTLDKSQWYSCDLSQISDELRSRFVQLDLDTETANFLDDSQIKSDSVFTQLWHSFVKSILSLFMTKTSINGLLGRGSMFVFSTPQFEKLLGVDTAWRAETVLDLGAGDGRTTDVMAPFFQHVYVTEISAPMRWTLTTKKYRLLEVDEWHLPPYQYDVISCLNLLDRCERPLTMLQQIRNALKPGGSVLLALVLPFSPFVEMGSNGNKPLEQLPILGTSFEEQVASLVRDVFEPAGFEVVAWAKVPYLCEGDLYQAFYWLLDAIFILRLPPSHDTDTDEEVDVDVAL